MQAENQPAPTKQSSAEAAVILFGRDEAGKAHASWFDQSEQALAEKAAGLMGMHVLPVTIDDHRALATRVARGRVFASGRAFAPFAKAELLDTLEAASGVAPGGHSRMKVAKAAPPAEKPPSARTGGKAAGSGKAAAKKQRQAVGEAADDGQADHATTKPEPAPDWGQLQAGHLVLASSGAGEGWFEAIITEAKPDNLFVLEWQDWPDESPIVRRLEHLALLHPDFITSEQVMA